MLDAIQIGAHKRFATTFNIYQATTSRGSISDLFVDAHPEEQKVDDPERPEFHRTDTVVCYPSNLLPWMGYMWGANESIAKRAAGHGGSNNED